MVEICRTKIVVVKKRHNGKLVPVLDENQAPVTKTLSAEVWHCTKKALDGHFCRDHGRRLVVGLN